MITTTITTATLETVVGRDKSCIFVYIYAWIIMKVEIKRERKSKQSQTHTPMALQNSG